MQENKPVPSVETSQKFMAWNIKEISENTKSLDMVLKSIDGSLKNMVDLLQKLTKASPSSNDLPF